MSTVARAFTGFRTAYCRTTRLQSSRILGRRAYASGQGHAAASSDMPWIATAAVITIPGVFFMTRKDPPRPSHGSHSAEEKHEEAADEAESKDSSEEDAAEKPEKEGEPTGEAKSDDGSSSDSDDDAPPTPASDDDGDSKKMDTSHDSQSEKLTDKPDSKRVDPTEK
ncbi:hypothetical protein B0H66DRAFT_165313 [Apodospora peruviana]|uniref:Uncharacterized protein n=1 Tax=Apodospora peruviana TaxID=516989 RepID=A0AAE0IK90_9PEZI|nr:hypothetical protein B0H66DRAFT_165313 [Apodospora peruviana]